MISVARLAPSRRSVAWSIACALAALLSVTFATSAGQQPLSALDVAKTRSVLDARISPDGTLVAFTVSVPRTPGADDDGGSFSELHVAGADGGGSRGYVTGEVEVGQPRFSPDGRFVSFLAKRGKQKARQIWAIPVAGGEAFALTDTSEEVRSYAWRPDGKALAFVSTDALPEKTQKLRDKGFNQEVFEEDWRPRRVFVLELPEGPGGERTPARALGDLPGQPWGLAYSPDGARLVTDLSPTPLVDDQYMFRRLHVIDAASGAVLGKIDNPGKLGEFDWSKDGSTILMVSGADINDTREGRLMAAPAQGGAPRDLLPGLEGHVEAFEPLPDGRVLYLAAVGVGTRLGAVKLDGSDAATVLERAEPVWSGLSVDAAGARAALVGESPSFPGEAFRVALDGSSEPLRLSESNPWLAERRLARQQAIRYPARDGLLIEGLLIEPLDRAGDAKVPLIVVAHGGPEAHYRNGWLTRYSSPGQVFAARGYAVFYPNYRGSTGRGVAFAKSSQGDPGGREFDDVLDGIDFLIGRGLVDAKRVGITGGSYGGYFTAWASTKYSERFAAGAMFVGISDALSKARTTDIPREDELVHMLTSPAENPKLYTDSSPINYTKTARTPLLILGGKKDTRVDPSQSKALHRALKLRGDVPVRLVWYPNEGHGNRNAAARYDYTLRVLRWFDHFLLQGKEDLPPWELEYDLP